MGFIALVALNAWAIRIWLDLRTDGKVICNSIDLMGYGGLPMADLLVAGLILGRSRPEMRRFLWRFEVCGVVALVLFLTVASFYTEECVQPYLLWILTSLPKALHELSPVVRVPLYYSIAMFLVLLPQAALALVGGLLSQARLTHKAHQ
jgi:hypothetical protein